MVVVVTVDVETGKVLTGPEIITRGWVYAPEAEDLLDEACERGRRGRRVEALAQRASATSRRSSATCAGPPGKFVSERTRRRPMIVPVVMEA